jgi:biopolymer transport protein ExbD
MPAADPAASEDKEMTEINVTPLVDVFMVLLVIFMVTASLVYTRVLPVKLPSSESGQGAVQTAWQLTVLGPGRYLLNDAVMSEPGMVARIRSEVAINPDIKINVAADESLRYRSVVAVLDLLKRQGVKQVALSVSPK